MKLQSEKPGGAGDPSLRPEVSLLDVLALKGAMAGYTWSAEALSALTAESRGKRRLAHRPW